MSISITEKFTRQVLDGMCKKYDYIVEDFSMIEGASVPWGLSKKLNDGTKIVLFFMKMEERILSGDFESNICSKVDCDRENLIKVILISENKVNSIEQISKLQNNSIVIDLINKSIKISDDKVEVVANQMASVMDSNTRNKRDKNDYKNSIVTFIIIGINIFMFAISVILSGSIMDIDINVLVALGAKYNVAIQGGQWFRLITCMFLHGGLIHIAANMYSLYCIGPLVESVYGRYKFIAIYIATGIISSLFSFWFSDAISIGASGAIFGLLGVVLVFAITERKRLGKSFLRNIASIVALNLFIGLSVKGIDNYAHLGGLLSGALIATVLSLNKKAK